MTKKRFSILIVLIITCILVLCIGKYFFNTDKDSSQNKQVSDEENNVSHEENMLSDEVNNGVIKEVDAAAETRTYEPLLLTASTSKLPGVNDTKSAYSIISSLDKQDSWIVGKFDNAATEVLQNNTYLSLNYYLPIESYSYRIMASNNSYRMIVNEYDQNNENVGYVDLCSGDILNIGGSVKYITITIYQYKNRQIVKNGSQNIKKALKDGLKFTVLIINDLGMQGTNKALLSSELNAESLSNYYNYRNGWYKSWGGTYEYSAASLCTRNYYKVDKNPYIININDSRISVEVSEYDANGKWVNYTSGLADGDSFTKKSKTSYIGLTVRSVIWGVDLTALFENGLKIDFASKHNINNPATISFANAELSDSNNWISGSYHSETGKYVIDKNKICYKNFCEIDDKEYVVSLPGGYLKMNILEYDKHGKVLVSNNMQSGRKWKKSKAAVKIAITIYGYDKTFALSDYKKLIAAYSNFGLKKYVKYSHNTIMRNIKAAEFIHQVNVGWNLGNSFDCTGDKSSTTANLKQETYWGNPYVTKDLIDYVAQCGFNTIRIPVTWYYNTYRDKNGTLRINQEWLDRVQDVVDYAIANHMYVIINSHNEQKIIYTGTDDSTMKKVLSDAKALWTDIAQYFKTYDEHLIFESYNEVDNIEKSWNYSDKAASQMNELNQVFVDAVRSTGGNNTNRILVVPTLLDGADSKFYSSFRLPKDIVADKIVVEVHNYSTKFDQDIESDFTEMDGFSKRIKAPIIIGEFGTTASYSLPELRTEQASNYIARAAEHGIKCIWWDNGTNYQIINRRDLSSSANEMITALIEGSKGIGYELEQEDVFNSPEQFVYRLPDLATGALKYTHWGSLTTDTGGSGVKVQKGSNYSISLKATNDATGIWIQSVLFYDEYGTLINSGKEIKAKYYTAAVPKNAVTMRVAINNPKINILQDDYKKYLINKDIEVGICFFNPNDLKKITLPLAAY